MSAYFDALKRSLDSWFGTDHRRTDCPENGVTDARAPVPIAHVDKLWATLDGCDMIEDTSVNVMLAETIQPTRDDPDAENDVDPICGCVQSSVLGEGMTGRLLLSTGTSGGVPVRLGAGSAAGTFRVATLLPSASNIQLFPYDVQIIPDKLYPLFPVDGTCAAVTSKSIRFIRARDNVDVTSEVIGRIERGHTAGNVAMIIDNASSKNVRFGVSDDKLRRRV